jgi:hypothetical protein
MNLVGDSFGLRELKSEIRDAVIWASFIHTPLVKRSWDQEIYVERALIATISFMMFALRMRDCGGSSDVAPERRR